jgi:hypothetical protein
MHEEINSRIISGNACYHSIQSLLSSFLLPRNVKVKIYKIIVLQVVLYGYETSSLTLKDERVLRVFENRVLRSTFGLERDEITGEWRRLHIGELHNLYSSRSIVRQIRSRRMPWVGPVARMGEGRKLWWENIRRKSRRKEATWKTEAWMGGWDQNGS